jgi:hypothetical protein
MDAAAPTAARSTTTHRQRDRQHDDEGRAERTQEDEDHHAGEQGAEQRGEL